MAFIKLHIRDYNKPRLTHACLGQIEEVDKLPVSADRIVCHVVRVFENKSLWTSEVDVVQLKTGSISLPGPN